MARRGNLRFNPGFERVTSYRGVSPWQPKLLLSWLSTRLVIDTFSDKMSRLKHNRARASLPSVHDRHLSGRVKAL